MKDRRKEFLINITWLLIIIGGIYLFLFLFPSNSKETTLEDLENDYGSISEILEYLEMASTLNADGYSTREIQDSMQFSRGMQDTYGIYSVEEFEEILEEFEERWDYYYNYACNHGAYPDYGL